MPVTRPVALGGDGLPSAVAPPVRKGGPGRAVLGRLRALVTFQRVVISTTILLVGYLALVPIGYLIWQTFIVGGRVSTRNFGDAYSAFEIGTLVRNSFVYAIGSTIVSLAVGTVFAYLVVRTDIRLKGLIFAGSLVPVVIPNILQTIAWIYLLSPRTGIYNKALEPILGEGFFDVFSMAGMIFVEGISLAPLCFLLLFAAFRSMDPSLEESAIMSGGSRVQTFRKVTLPLVRPSLFAAALIMMVRALEAFETPALLGMPQRIYVFTSLIWNVLRDYPPSYGQAGAYSISLLLITTAGVVAQSRLSAKGRKYQTVTGKGFRPHPIELGRARLPLTLVTLGYFLATIVIPALMLVFVSFQPYYSGVDGESFSRMTLRSYRAVLTDPEVLGATRNTAILALTTATTVMFTMAIVSWFVVRSRVRGRAVLDVLTFLPITVPGIVLGVALLVVYLRVPIPIYGSMWILLIAYFTRFMPYGIRYASTSAVQIGSELEESAYSSGASWWQTFRRVDLPLLMPGLLAGWIYIVMVSTRELSSSLLLYSPGDEVLSVLIWQRWEGGQFTELSAIGVLMIVVLGLFVTVAQKLGSRIGIRG